MPWRRLLREYVIYAAIMAAVLMVLNRGRDTVPLLVGLVLAGPLYIGLGVVLAKFGYQRKTLAELRTPRATSASASAGAATAPMRERPAPTRRTSTGRNRSPRPTRKKR